MRRPPRIRYWALLLLLALVPSVGRADEPGIRRALGPGTAWETPVYLQRSAEPGPTVLVIGGIHGDEPAGAMAAEQIRHWVPKRGRLVIVPRANTVALAAGKRRTPGVPKELGDLNRNFPRVGRDDAPRGERAAELWALVKSVAPDYVVDLHEGFDFNTSNPKSVGSTVIASTKPAARVAAGLMVRGVNTLIDKASRRWRVIGPPINGSLARAAAEHLGAHAFIVETTTKGQARSRRVRQHRHAVHRLLMHLGMVDRMTPADGLRPADPDTVLVGLYDSTGTGGPGVPLLSKQLAAAKGIDVVRIGPDEVRTGGIFACDVLLFPGGSAGSQARKLDPDGRRRVRAFIEGGGGYVGICAGAYLCLDGYSWGLKVVNAKTISPKWARGGATLPVELTERGKEIFGDLGGPVPILYHNGPVIEPSTNTELPGMEPLAYFRGEVAKNGTPRGIMKDSPAIYGGTFGKGRVIAFSPHPEQTRGREGMVLTAVRWVARKASTKSAAHRLEADGRDALGDASAFDKHGDLSAKRETLARWFRLDRGKAHRAIRDAVVKMAAELEARHATRVARWEEILPGISAPMPHTKAHAKPLIEIMNRQDGETFHALEQLLIDTTWRMAQRGERAWRPLLIRASSSKANPFLRMQGARLAGWLVDDAKATGAGQSLRRALKRYLGPSRERDSRVRIAAYDALAERADGPSERVLQGLDDPDWDVRVRAAQIVELHRMASAAPRLEAALAGARLRERATYERVLERLTGQKPEKGSTPRASFYGIEVESERVLFLLDCSASMAEPVAGSEGDPTTRFQAARAELEQALRLLPSDARFGVIAFSTAVQSWQPGLQPATQENRLKALAWLEGMTPDGNTCLWGAFRTALRQAHVAPRDGREPPVDTLMMFTDGKPTWYGVDEPGWQNPHQLRRWVRAWNQHGLIRIHTIGPKGAPGAGLLRAIAHDHNGTFAVR